ncbi:UDP-glucuronosyltransferase 2A1-like protein [Labeo rohita]|uniref:UDP-glucuronosyltransferase 2A1-like protein n=1 Tax=Labeo rohita TaxID=84645 RepID=A0A498N333_LABRO|nr:UDP-glucuronosyltransferase 2A1-like protein [Labeo rohita]
MRLVVCFLSLLTVFGPAKCGNVLVWFTEGSHWINLKIVLEALIDRGHNITVLIPDTSLYMKAKESDRFSYQPFNVSMDEEDMRNFIDEFVYFSVYETDELNFLQILMKVYKFANIIQDMNLLHCDGILKSSEVMDILRNGKFDVVLSDPLYPCSDIVAAELNGPLVYTFRAVERLCGQIPAPPSFVPASMSKLTDKMDFKERIINMLFYLPLNVFSTFGLKRFDNYYTEYLGHPKTRAFITHGGTNSIYEAIYHAIPMVGIPLFGDQPDNLAHMKAKGAAVVMDNIKTTQPQDLVDGLNAVINDPSYKQNAMHLSRIHHDRPMKPLDEAVFWIEFVMRNKGAKHLRVEAHNLTWYQYHCLDVFAFLITVLTVVLYVFFKMCKFFIMRCCFRSKRKSKKE